MLKFLKAFFGIKPNKATYKKVSDIAHYGGQTPEWAVNHQDYRKGASVGEITHGGHNLVRKFTVTKKHLSGGK